MHHVGNETEMTHRLHLPVHCFSSAKMKQAWNRAGRFVCISARLNARVCVSMIMLVSAFMCIHMCTQEAACVQQAT